MQVELGTILATIRIFVENIKEDRGRYFQMEKYRLFLLLSTHEGYVYCVPFDTILQ